METKLTILLCKFLCYLPFSPEVSSIISCFEEANGYCDDVFNDVIIFIQLGLIQIKGINASNWQNFEDVEDAFEICDPGGIHHFTY